MLCVPNSAPTGAVKDFESALITLSCDSKRCLPLESEYVEERERRL